MAELPEGPDDRANGLSVDPINPTDPDDLAAATALTFDTAHFRAVPGHFLTGHAVGAGPARGLPRGRVLHTTLRAIRWAVAWIVVTHWEIAVARRLAAG